MKLRAYLFLPAAWLMWPMPVDAGTVPVFNTNNALAGSLRQAIQDASAGDTIVFQIPTTDAGYNGTTRVFTITLTSDQLLISKALTIDGGRQRIVVQRSTAGGTPNFRIFHVTTGGVTIAGLTIANGNGAAPDGLAGGGIRNSGALTVRDCTLQNNDGSGNGGGFYNVGSAVLVNCTLRANTAGYGGGICNRGATVTVNHCTLVGNTANGQDGGAIYQNGSTLTVTNSTITGNTATIRGGGINSPATSQVRNTIIAGNTVGSGASSVDVYGTFISDGYNFIGVFNNQATGFGNAGSHDQVGTTASPANPQLGPLQDNGGPTFTQAPLFGSPLIDQGKGAGATSDQRGQPRPIDQPGVNNALGGDTSDIGAVETGLLQTGPIFTVTNTSEHYDGRCTVDDCTLAEALTAANANPDANTVNFAPGVTGQITTNALTPSGLFISNPVTINGPGARMLTISGEYSARIFEVVSQGVVISGLTIANGYRTTADGGAIHNTGGLTLSDCAISNSSALNSGNGGAIYNSAGAALALVRCTLFGNVAGGLGGALYNDGAFGATNCTFSNCAAQNGGGIISRFQNGNSSAALRNCTITNCRATIVTAQDGGGYYAEGGPQQHFFSNTIIAGNTAITSNPDVRGQCTSDGHNFIGTAGSSTGFTNGVKGDQVGTNAARKYPQLGLLTNNGGPTDTHALLSTSTAINAGDNAFAPPTDQRGFSRSGISDIGAFEFGGSLTLKITSILRLPNGHIALQGLGAPSGLHTFEASPDLSIGSFDPIGTVTGNATGALQFDDAGAVGLTKRFYRLTYP